MTPEQEGGRPVVLVVDDEQAIRYLCRVNLELDGFDVLEAETLDEARSRLAEADVAVVVLDMHVGRERGEELFEELQRRVPPIPVAVITGSIDVERVAGGRAQAVLAKPFTIEELSATVRALAAASQSPR